MILRISKIILLFILFLAFALPNFFNSEGIKVLAEGAEITPLEERQTLEKELEGLEKQISQYEKDITKTQREKTTLQNKIYILRNEIEKLDLQIYQSNLIIRDLGLQINDTESSIEKTSLRIKETCQKLIEILREIYEEDQRSLVEILLQESKSENQGNLSDFFDNLVQLGALNAKNKELLDNIKDLKTYLESQGRALSEEKEDTEKMVRIQTLQQEESKTVKEEEEGLLKITQGKESLYQKLLSETQEKAQEIRSRIFELIGVPEAPTFGEAYEIAKFVSAQTGVRPALLLAVLTQESNIGKNVGQCYLTNPETGAGLIIYNNKKISRVMKPSRDVSPFLKITEELGRNYQNTPVSCPMSYGWGGAMGPAQFIPSTWILYRDRVKAITGKPADPWNINDAFLAAALYLADYGATSQTYNGEWRAAMIYFSGSTNLKYRFYGDSVINLAAEYQNDIKTLEAGK